MILSALSLSLILPPFPAGNVMPKKVSFPCIMLKIQHCFKWGVGGGGEGRIASCSNISGKIKGLNTFHLHWKTGTPFFLQ